MTLNSTCNGSIVSVTNLNSGEKITGARIVLSTDKDVKNTLTDALGMGKLNLCDTNLHLSVSASGYADYDVRLSGISCSCGTAIIKECQLTTDCKNPFICKQNKCILECTTDANCTLGYACSNNKCVPKPQCTSNTDCAKNQICISNICTDKPECQSKVDCTGSNKICSNQKCVECLVSSDCGTGKSCVTNVCIQNVVDKKYSFVLPQSFKLNEQTTISVLENDLACQNCNVAVLDPSGKTITTTTDTNGKFIVTPKLAGTYGISLLVNGKEMANSNFVATAPEIVKPSSDNNGLLIAGIVIVVIAIAGIAYFVMNNKNK